MKQIPILFFLFASFIFAGCSQKEEKVNGSIFIVTRGGENFKLGLITVFLLNADQVQTNSLKVTADLKKNLANLEKEIILLNEESNKLSAQLITLEQKYNNYKKITETAAKVGSGERPAVTREDIRHLEDLKKMAIEYRRLSNWASSQGSESEKKQMCQQFLDLPATYSSASYEIEWLEKKNANLSEEQVLWDKWHPIYITNSFDTDKLLAELNKIQIQAVKVSESLSLKTAELGNWPLIARNTLFNNLPAQITSVKSDADGKFFVQIPTKGEYILAARGERQVSDNVEKYAWLVQIQADKKSEMQILLSNDNLMPNNSF